MAGLLDYILKALPGLGPIRKQICHRVKVQEHGLKSLKQGIVEIPGDARALGETFFKQQLQAFGCSVQPRSVEKERCEPERGDARYPEPPSAPPGRKNRDSHAGLLLRPTPSGCPSLDAENIFARCNKWIAGEVLCTGDLVPPVLKRLQSVTVASAIRMRVTEDRKSERNCVLAVRQCDCLRHGNRLLERGVPSDRYGLIGNLEIGEDHSRYEALFLNGRRGQYGQSAVGAKEDLPRPALPSSRKIVIHSVLPVIVVKSSYLRIKVGQPVARRDP